MKLNFLKKFGFVLLGTVAVIYGLFLILPFIITPIAKNYIPMVNDEIKKATGLNSQIEDFKIITTPKFTVGAELGKFAILTPQNKEIFEAEDFSVKMSLLPLLARRIEVDLVQVGSVDLKLGVNKDGSFEVEKYLPEGVNAEEKINNTEPEAVETTNLSLPFGLRLSNHLPDIKIGEYDIEFIDLSNNKKYEIEGGKTEITDFILNKGVKLSANGKAKFDEREQFVYNLKINNRIMPDLDLHDLVFNPAEVNEDDKNKSQNTGF